MVREVKAYHCTTSDCMFENSDKQIVERHEQYCKPVSDALVALAILPISETDLHFIDDVRTRIVNEILNDVKVFKSPQKEPKCPKCGAVLRIKERNGKVTDAVCVNCGFGGDKSVVFVQKRVK